MKTNPYIINFEPKFIEDKSNNASENQFEVLISKAIQLTFKKLANQIDLNIIETPLTNRCDLVRNKLGEVLESYGVNVKYLETQDILDNDVVGHSLMLVEDGTNENKKYLVDPTYSQFFLKEKCSQDEYMIYKDVVVKAPDPGYYFLVNEDKQELAKGFLENGYMKLTEENCKMYADSFYTTKRGREAVSNLKNPPNISGSIYMKSFLKENKKTK